MLSPGVLPILKRSIRSKSQGFTLLSDLHVGSRLTDYERLKSDLVSAKHRSDRILILGDLVDAILPRDPKRYTPSKLHKRLQGSDNVLDATVDWCVELLEPVKGLIDLIAYGNHETAVITHHSTDPIKCICDKLGVTTGGYAGFVDYAFPGARHLKIGYWHGRGRGDGLKSVIDDWRRVSTLTEGLDVVWTGHRHHRMAMHSPKLSLSGSKLRERQSYSIITGSYMRPYSDRATGKQDNYAADGLMMPGGTGGVSLNVETVTSGLKLSVTL